MSNETGHQVSAVRFSQDGTILYVTALSAKMLNDVGVIDTWKPELSEDDPAQGYQRDVVQAHAKRIARYISNPKLRRLMPTAVLLSARRALDFRPEKEGGVELPIGKLTIDRPLYIPDGQHRTRGLGIAMKENEDLEDFMLPVVIMQGIQKPEEVRQFYTINATAKRVRTDLADRLLKAMGEFDDAVTGWRATALEVVDLLLDKKDGPWVGRIKLPNGVTGIASQRTFTESMKPVLDGVLKGQEAEVVAGAMNNLWLALKALMPDAFANPDDYVLQKSVGVFVWNRVAAHVFLICYQGGNNFSVDNIKTILEPAGDFVTEGYWLNTKRGGTAPNYQGMAGFAALAADIQEILPQPEIRINIA